MDLINAHNVTIDFPIYSLVGNRSLKKTLISATTGGFFANDAKDTLSVRALDRLSFEFKNGDRVGIVGHNGAGKTTLLQLLAGIYEPCSGELFINGKVTSMLGITLGMDAEATGGENIFLRGSLMGMTKKEINDKYETIVSFSGLGEFIDLPMRTYSSGMQMRLAFSIATSMDADIILMDEWLSAGDSDFLVKAQTKIGEIVGNSRLAIIASHNHNLINERCNVILTLEHGSIKSLIRKTGTSNI